VGLVFGFPPQFCIVFFFSVPSSQKVVNLSVLVIFFVVTPCSPRGRDACFMAPPLDFKVIYWVEDFFPFEVFAGPSHTSPGFFIVCGESLPGRSIYRTTDLTPSVFFNSFWGIIPGMFIVPHLSFSHWTLSGQGFQASFFQVFPPNSISPEHNPPTSFNHTFNVMRTSPGRWRSLFTLALTPPTT